VQYRRLGRTELQVSVLGVGGGYLMLLDQQEGTRLYERAWDLGLNYFDGRYGDSSAKLKPVIKRGRERCVVVSKTQDRTKEQALERVDEDLRELDTDYIDIYYLRTYNHDMLQEHLTPGGSMEGLLEAKAKGKVRFIGLAGHSDLTALAAGIETGLVDAVIFPFNIVRRDALDVLIPTAIKYDVGLVVMKPMNVGLVPAPLALAWLANQPIHTMVPGMSHIEHLEMDVAAVERDPMALTPEEEAAIECARQEADRISCRICDKVCQPLCEAKIPLDWFLYHDVYYNEYLNLGLEQLLEMPLTPWFKASVEGHFARRLAMIQSCTHCGKCEQACPYHIQIMDMFEKMLEDHKIIIDAVHAKGWTETYKDAAPPFQPPRRPGGKK
jgi:predicted aldo/keto reductase-like oxidoreductase